MYEKRKHMRLPLVLDVEIKKSNSETICRGRTKNVSFGGVLLDCFEPQALNAGEVCGITLLLNGGAAPLKIEFEAEVMHKGEIGLGLKFLKFQTLNLESYRHFKNLMVLNSPDPEKLLEELYNNPGLLPME